jgi:tetratricopeptide (TPR) repeat protein
MARIANVRQMQQARHWIPESGIEVEEGIRLAWQAFVAGRGDPDVLRAAGYAVAYLAGENEAALRAFDRAIDLNPNYAGSYTQRALNWLNRPDEAIVAAEQAIRLSPNDPGSVVHAAYIALSLAHLLAGRHEEALSWAERAVRENAGLPALRMQLCLCGHLRRREEAGDCLERLRETYPAPNISTVMRDFAKGMSPEFAAHIAEGLRKAGLPES